MTTEKPEIVKKATLLLWGSLGIGLVRSVIEFPRLVEQAAAFGGAKFVVSVQLFTFLFSAGLVWAIGKRQNWARWVYSVLFILGIPLSINPLIQSLIHTPLSGVLGLVQAVAQLVAVVLLFQAPARAWFKKQPQQQGTP